jgi:hypothetical protein
VWASMVPVGGAPVHSGAPCLDLVESTA